MAARARRRTNWFGCDLTPLTLTGLGNGERKLLETGLLDSPPEGSTLLRIVGTITTTVTRTTVVSTTSSPENCIMRVGLMVSSLVPGNAGSPDLDLDDEDHLADERWLWVQTRAHRITTQAYLGASGVTTYAHYDAGQHPHFDVDVRAKRRWIDPMVLSIHGFAVGESAACTIRPALRALFALP